MGGGWGDFFDKARQPEPWRKWSASPRGRGVREAVRAAVFRCFRGITRGTHRARVGEGLRASLWAARRGNERLVSWTIVPKASSRPPPRDLFFAFFDFSLYGNQSPNRRAARAAQSLVRDVHVSNGRRPCFRASVSRRRRSRPSRRPHCAVARVQRLDRRWRRPAGRTRSRARHPRARARGARAVGRPAPVAPASAGSRRCSCSASPRSPSRA